MEINLEFLVNQVDAGNQVSYPFYYDGTSVDEANYKVLFIGNSITIHEPKPDIGWVKKCGMAASDIDHDYVHILYRYLVKKYKKVSICVFNGGRWEMDFTNNKLLEPILDRVKEYKPDMVIVRIGENFSRNYLNSGVDPYLGFSPLIKGIKKNCNNIYFSSMFWHHDLMDNTIKKIVEEEKVNYVKIDDLGSERKYLAYDQYKNNAIYCGHPGDLGMEKIAERFIEAFEK